MSRINSIYNFINRQPKPIFSFLLLCVLVDRINLLLRFSLVYTDSDQTLLWQAANDLVQGNFHGYCFYGQSYNPLIEPLLSVPLLIMGLGEYIALPIITSLLAITPFIIIAWYLIRKFDLYTALIPLIILLLLPPEFGMLTSLTRGFVTGVFFGSIGVMLLMLNRRFLDLIGGALLVFSFYANPNSILLFPLVIPALLVDGIKTPTRVVYMIIGGIVGVIPQIMSHLFYTNNANMIIHESPNLSLSFDSFIYVFNHLDNYFGFVSPVFWIAGWISLLLFIIIGFRLWKRKEYLYFITVILLFLGIIGSFFSDKVTDGTNSIFFSGSRMFLAYPIILIFIVLWWFQGISIEKKRKWIMVGIGLSLISITVKLSCFDTFLNHALRGSASTIVGVTKIDDLKNKCKEMINYNGAKPDLIVASTGNTSEQLITYGCSCLIENFPTTVQPLYERRQWVLNHVLNTQYNTVLFHAYENQSLIELKENNELDILSENKAQWLIVSNNKKTEELLKNMELTSTKK